jgi:hypothetical protein
MENRNDPETPRTYGVYGRIHPLALRRSHLAWKL